MNKFNVTIDFRTSDGTTGQAIAVVQDSRVTDKATAIEWIENLANSHQLGVGDLGLQNGSVQQITGNPETFWNNFYSAQKDGEVGFDAVEVTPDVSYVGEYPTTGKTVVTDPKADPTPWDGGDSSTSEAPSSSGV